MCCCCPPAISALFCLWFRNGCSKASVAGALTFFPPNPALYQFERVSKDGEKLSPSDADDEEEKEEQENCLEINKSAAKANHKPSHPQNTLAALSERQKALQQSAKKKFLLDQADVKNGTTYKCIVPSSICPARFSPYIEQMEALKIYNSKAKSYIATVIYRYTSATVDTSSRSTMTLIYSHGNATDIGGMSFMHCYLAKALNLNIVMYDYSGYGESGGTPLERNTYSDIETVYGYVLEHVANGDSRSIILYGQSVGSGPSCYLASRKSVGGLILHSPFTSGMRVLTPSRALACLDIFPNIDRVKMVSCQVMIIHGLLDEEVNHGHGVALYNAVPNEYRSEPWWVPDRGHNDICEGQAHMNQYIRRLKTFLNSLNNNDGSRRTTTQP